MFKREPALILGALGALIAVAVGFGLDVTDEQVGLIMAAVSAVLALVVRQSVYSPETVEKIAPGSTTEV
jgi:hypothetical protein